jgi:Heat shock protein
MKNITKIAIVLAAVVIAAGCCPCRKGSGSSLPLEGTQWFAVKMDNKYLHTEPDSEAYTLLLQDGKVSGKGDCNRIMGSYAISGNKSLIFEGVASTRMMCPDQATEDLFLRKLADVDAYSVDGNNLMLIGKGETVMVLSSSRVIKQK